MASIVMWSSQLAPFEQPHTCFFGLSWQAQSAVVVEFVIAASPIGVKYNGAEMCASFPTTNSGTKMSYASPARTSMTAKRVGSMRGQRTGRFAVDANIIQAGRHRPQIVLDGHRVAGVVCPMPRAVAMFRAKQNPAAPAREHDARPREDGLGRVGRRELLVVAAELGATRLAWSFATRAIRHSRARTPTVFEKFGAYFGRTQAWHKCTVIRAHRLENGDKTAAFRESTNFALVGQQEPAVRGEEDARVAAVEVRDHLRALARAALARRLRRWRLFQHQRERRCQPAGKQ